MRIIAFSGPKYSGKDTAAKALFSQNDRFRKQLFRRAPMAEGVKNVCREMFGYNDQQLEDPLLKETKTETFPFVEPRWPMMDIANFLRDKYGGAVHCHRWERVANERDYANDDEDGWACHVMTDLRFPEELKMLARVGGKLFYIQNDKAEGELRLKQESGNAMALNPSEGHYMLIREHATEVIDNNGTIAHLHAQVHALTQRHYKFWGQWDAAPMLYNGGAFV